MYKNRSGSRVKKGSGSRVKKGSGSGSILKKGSGSRVDNQRHVHKFIYLTRITI